MRDALEEAQRWNTSLQARLGQIQSRGGGVGQANDVGMYTRATRKTQRDLINLRGHDIPTRL